MCSDIHENLRQVYLSCNTLLTTVFILLLDQGSFCQSCFFLNGSNVTNTALGFEKKKKPSSYIKYFGTFTVIILLEKTGWSISVKVKPGI